MILCLVFSGWLQWINAYTVVAMDTTERVHLLSVKTDTEIEVSGDGYYLCVYTAY